MAVEPIHIHPCPCQTILCLDVGSRGWGKQPCRFLLPPWCSSPASWHSVVGESRVCSLLCLLRPLQHWDNDSGNAEIIFKSKKLTLKKNEILYKTAWLWLSYTKSCKTDLQQYHLKCKITKINRFVMSLVTVELKTSKLTSLPAETSHQGWHTPSSWVLAFSELC